MLKSPLLVLLAVAFTALAAQARAEVSASSPKLSAFIDPQYYWTNQDAPNLEGFVLNDAALYLTQPFGRGEAKIDLPFKGEARGNFFSLTSGKAQAYFEYRLDIGLKWKFGQWDTPFGIEANDTADLSLTRQGRIFTVLLPLTHLGVMASYATEVVGVNFLVADSQNRGALVGHDPEFGAQFTIAALPKLKLTPGALIQKVGDEYRKLYEIVLKTSQGAWNADFGFDLLQVPGVEQVGKGFMVSGDQALTEDLSVSGRFEYLADHDATLDGENQDTVGVQYAVAKNLKLKADYTWNRKYLVRGESQTSHQVALAGVFRFE